MSRKWTIFYNRRGAAFLIAITTFLILVVLAGLMLRNFSAQIQEENEYQVSLMYHNMMGELQDFKNQNISLLAGFSAYIQMNERHTDDEINTYLNYLLRDHLNDIKNIGVFEDTTIKWMYPMEGNESAIGVDLSKVPEQAEDVKRVKNNLETLFVGPVNLIQGGVGFIIRMPLLKNDQFWGMVSIVLKAEQAFGFIDSFSEQNRVEYLITYADQETKVIYGNPEVLSMSPLKFRTDVTMGGWDVYTVPKNGWQNQDRLLWIMFIIAIIVAVLISRFMYNSIINYNLMASDKVALEQKYLLDRFTGIYTREHFNQRVREEIKQIERYDYPISMIYFDLDHFKNVNDTYGHASGDKVLLQVVDAVKSIIRAGDVFARWGGDEFILLLPHTDLEGALILGERIRFDIEHLEICKKMGVTASVGCSQWETLEYVESWFARTDNALYKSKNSGKNKITGSSRETEKEILVRVNWDDTWISNHPVIDQEHKELLKICNTIIESSLNKAFFNDTLRSVEAFLKEIEKHFDDEIEILRACNYPYVEEHAIIHENILKQSKALYLKTANEDITPIELFHFLLTIVMKGHINTEDVRYRIYLDVNNQPN